MDEPGHSQHGGRGRPWAAAGVLLGALVVLATGAFGELVRRANVAAVLPPVNSRTSPGASPGTPPLVHVDDELGGYLHEAKRLIEKDKKYDQAIQILQALIQREDSGFYSEGANRFVSMRRKANNLLGRMGPKGLKLYRALYDPQAERLYEEALASDRPEQYLRRLSERYLHTSYGPKALETLGALYFDRARFSQAASCWWRLLPLAPDGEQRVALLAKVAAACHLGGESEAAGRAAEQLRKDFPDASAVLGGKTQSLAEFLRRVWRMPVVTVDAPLAVKTGWPGLGGIPSGLSAMSGCDVVLAPRWRQAGERVSPGEDLLPRLKAGLTMYLSDHKYNRYASRNVRRSVRLSRGHLILRRTVSSRSQGETVLPGLVHPVVWGDQVIVRLDDSTAGFDLLTGETRWKSLALPMVRQIGPIANTGYYSSGGYKYVGDSGRYALTVGGGMAFTVYDFLPAGDSLGYVLRRNPNMKGLDDGSRLAALSLSADGRLVWRVGRGLGDHEVIRNGMFLSAPTYRAGRLYVMMLYLQRYHVVCLDARNKGAMIWQAPVAQAPAVGRRSSYAIGADPRLSVGSPPAVADGRVYVTTNSGAVAGFEEETGEPLWAYQYTSVVNRPGSISSVSSRYPGRLGVHPPGNPIIVSRGNVVCLPADSEKLLGLDAATGELRWAGNRRSQMDLSAIDADRVLMSGPGLIVRRVIDGAELNRGSEDVGISGRPAVTSHEVLASAMGRVESMDLKTYGTSPLGLASADGFLGNLVSANGKLISASMLGVCTYFGYDSAREELTRRIESTPAPQRPPLLKQRAQLAYDAKRYAKALEDFKACEALTKAQGDTQTGAQLPPLLYMTYVALGNHAAGDAQMHEMFLHAEAYATTTLDKAHLKLRLAKYHERVGEYTAAVELAQQVAEEYGEEELYDIVIGPEAGDAVRSGPRRRTVRGDKLVRAYVRDLLAKHGHECYAKFDAEAKRAFDEARAAGEVDRVLDVEKRWPNSQWADDALFEAAELFYRRAQADKASADDDLAEARRHLYRVARTKDSPLRVSASVALATIYSRGGWKTSAQKECEVLADLDGETEVAFADVRGKLRDVLKLIEGGKLANSSRPMRMVSTVRPPLAEVFQVKGEHVCVLRDQELRPIRLGEKIAIIKDGDAYLLDTAADSEAKALAEWKGLASVDKDDAKKYAHYPPGMRLVGGVSRDGKVLAVADRKSIRGLDLVSAKVVWDRQMAKIGIASFYTMGVGSGVLVVADRSGKVSCLDIATGEVSWQGNLVGGNRCPSGPPRIVGDMVVFQHDSGKRVTCFSLAKGGRVVGRWPPDGSASQWTQCEVTPDGLLAMIVNGELTVRELGKLDKPLWRQQHNAAKYPAILAISAEQIAVSPQNNSGRIEVLSVLGGGKLATLQARPVSGAAAIPFDARFQDDNLYVLCAPSLSGRRKAIYGRLSSARGLNVQKFTVSDEKHRWSVDFDEHKNWYYRSMPPIVVGRDHVVVTARHHQASFPYYAYVLHSQTGKAAQKIDLRGGAPAADESRRRQGTGPPVLTNGRLCAETSKGVIVYGER